MKPFPDSIKNALAVLSVLAFFFLAVGVAHGKGGIACIERQVARTTLMKNGYAYLGTFINEYHIVLQVFVHRDGRWVLLGVDNADKACILLQGYEHAIGREA